MQLAPSPPRRQSRQQERPHLMACLASPGSSVSSASASVKTVTVPSPQQQQRSAAMTSAVPPVHSPLTHSTSVGTPGSDPSMAVKTGPRQLHGQNFSVDSAAFDSSAACRQALIDKRKNFRCRGSLGPTVASAPSVEQEDYRTPRPIDSTIIGQNYGKSFDFGGVHTGSVASDSNALVKVSADFLRLNGSRQQFRSLLSRKKLGQLPSAYTRIDYSYDSIESNPSAKAPLVPLNPEIRVEEAVNSASFDRENKRSSSGGVEHGGGERAIAQHKLDEHHHPHAVNVGQRNQRLSISSVLVDSKQSSVESKSTTGENGGLVHTARGATPTIQKAAHMSLISGSLKRGNSRYGGAPIDESQVKMVYKIRSLRLSTRVQITNRCLLLALLGVALMVVDNEICSQQMLGINKDHPFSLVLRVMTLLSTVALLIEIVHFHVNETILDMVDCGADDFRVVVTWPRIIQFGIEFLLCGLCPIPFNSTVSWTFVEPRHLGHFTSIKDVPLNVPLSVMMLSRVYLIGRFMVLHSKQFQDASTRTLAALNRIQVNFAFVMKSLLDQRPILFLSLFLIIFWFATAWTFAQCERWGREGETPSILYTNALWFIAITFNGNGYGDIVPKTLAGKIIAITVGIFGAVITAILIAVISRKILLSQGQRNVNNFVDDSRLMQLHKNAAARVLQKTWLIYRCLQQNNSPDHILRKHQRRFLDAIHDFRKIKNKIRVFNEKNSTSFQQMNRLINEMHSSMQKLLSNQEEMRAQVEVLQRAMRNHFIEAQVKKEQPVEAKDRRTSAASSPQQQRCGIASQPYPHSNVRTVTSHSTAGRDFSPPATASYQRQTIEQAQRAINP